MTHALSFQVKVADSYEAAIERVTAALKVEGFGVLTRIDVQTTLKEKINEDFRPYVILGACNPVLAHKALQNDAQVGLLLPCNVTVEETDDGVLISVINPDAMLGVEPIASNPAILEVATEARTRLERVVDALRN